jgi:hypothetical protein
MVVRETRDEAFKGLKGHEFAFFWLSVPAFWFNQVLEVEFSIVIKCKF